jgi:hypothetical protein
MRPIYVLSIVVTKWAQPAAQYSGVCNEEPPPAHEDEEERLPRRLRPPPQRRWRIVTCRARPGELQESYIRYLSEDFFSYQTIIQQQQILTLPSTTSCRCDLRGRLDLRCHACRRPTSHGCVARARRPPARRDCATVRSSAATSPHTSASSGRPPRAGAPPADGYNVFF